MTEDRLEEEIEELKRRYRRLTGKEWQPRRRRRKSRVVTEEEQRTFLARKLIELGHAGRIEFAGRVGPLRRVG